MRRNIQLKHLNRSGNWPTGNERWYYRPKGEKGVRLPDFPHDHPKFLAAYAEAAGAEPRRPVLSGSIADAIIKYKKSDDFACNAASTRAVRRPILDEFSVKYGSGRIADLSERHVLFDLKTFNSHRFNNRLKVWKAFCNWLVKVERSIETSPAKDISKAVVPKTDGHIPWSDEEIQAFRGFWPIGAMERLAFELLFWTGARVSDMVKLGEGHINREGWLIFIQQKTGGEVSIPFNRDLPEFAEVLGGDLALLKQAINCRNERHVTFLTTVHGAARSGKAVSSWFAEKARKAGIENRTAHGLRKSRAIALVEAGATSIQTGAWTGHESLSEIERYIKKYNKRKVLSRSKEEQKVPTFPEKVPIIGIKGVKSNG